MKKTARPPLAPTDIDNAINTPPETTDSTFEKAGQADTSPNTQPPTRHHKIHFLTLSPILISPCVLFLVGWYTGEGRNRMVPSLIVLHYIDGSVLLSHTLAGAVPSALASLASRFGMGLGVS